MAATVHRFRSTRDRLKADQGDELRQLLLDLGEERNLPADAVTRIVAAIDGETASDRGWTFVMIGPVENQAVVDWLYGNSRRPKAATRVWAMLFTALRYDTGEIALTREEIAEHVGTAPRNVSSIMTELVGIGAVSRTRDGRMVRYFMNPTIGTKLTGKARDRAQDEGAQLKLV